MRVRIADYLPQVVLLANAVAFGLLLAELLITEHTDGIQIVAPATAFVGIVLCLVALALPSRLRTIPAVLLVALSVSGIIGFVQHMEGEEDEGSGAIQSRSDEDDDEADERDEDGEDDDPPPLAPLGLSGTALLGAIAALATPSRRDR